MKQSKTLMQSAFSQGGGGKTLCRTSFNPLTTRKTLCDLGFPKLNRRCAFTLAEVLITLGIIGVVAAMTLPTLINNYQKKQTIAQLKKAYSELSQAIAIAQKDLGMIEDWDFANFPTQADSAQYFYENVLKPNIKIVKYCAPSSNDCWPDKVYTLTRTDYNIASGNTSSKANSFITASGYSVFYWLNASGIGGWFFIDLNGSRKPNMLGKDIFVFMLYNKKINAYGTSVNLGLHPHGLHANPTMTREDIILGNYPYQVNADAGGCSVTSTRSPGVSCSALIMLDNWEIKDDYPWN